MLDSDYIEVDGVLDTLSGLQLIVSVKITDPEGGAVDVAQDIIQMFQNYVEDLEGELLVEVELDLETTGFSPAENNELRANLGLNG